MEEKTGGLSLAKQEHTDFCTFLARGGEIWLSDTQQHSLSLNDPVYVSTMQQASGYCTR
jgi:hypothetical protein